MIGESIDEPYLEELLKGAIIKVIYKNIYRVCEI